MADEDDDRDDVNDESPEEEDDDDVQRRLKDAVDEGDDEDDDESDSDADEQLGERGKRALDRMKEERKRLKAEMREMAEKVKKYEDSQKSESQRLSDDAASYKEKWTAAEQKLIRLEVASEKGLSPKQAARLTGTTKEELEEDADELLEIFKPSAKEKANNGKPKERLRGGGDPEEEPEESHPQKLAALIPRNRF